MFLGFAEQSGGENTNCFVNNPPERRSRVWKLNETNGERKYRLYLLSLQPPPI